MAFEFANARINVILQGREIAGENLNQRSRLAVKDVLRNANLPA
jgi:hypothetical protein